MPHTSRRKSETGFYHVVIKGDGGQIIFESDADRMRILDIVKSTADDIPMLVHAYCLMNNHVHFLLEDRQDNLSSFMKRVNERYAMHFRGVTGRVGHVFQGRFWSEPIDSDERFLTTLRYIHANPEPAGICRAKDYPWSSYASYVGTPTFVHTDLALELLGSVAAFEEFQLPGGAFASPFPKSSLTRHLSYDELNRVAIELLGRDRLSTLKQLKPRDRHHDLTLLKRAGFTEMQIARLTGIGQATIHRTLHINS